MQTTQELKEIVNIKGREYVVAGSIACGDLTAANMQKNGWLPFVHQLEGKRGAVWMAQKTIANGEFVLCQRLRKF